MTRVIDVYRVHSFPGGFYVSVKPPLADGNDRASDFADHGKAMAYARVLRLEFGFLITGATADNVALLDDARKRRRLSTGHTRVVIDQFGGDHIPGGGA